MKNRNNLAKEVSSNNSRTINFENSVTFLNPIQIDFILFFYLYLPYVLFIFFTGQCSTTHHGV